jgi:hypothetical protein
VRSLVLLFLLGACSSDRPPPDHDAGEGCAIPFAGDRSKPIEMTLTVLGPDAKSRPLAGGDKVPLIFPPQGGRVIFVGVKARNLDPCEARISGVLRDKSTQQIRIDARTATLEPTPDGWVTSTDANIASFANVPVCPNQWASTDAFDNVFEMSVTLTDRSGRTLNQKIDVTPECAEPAMRAECLCICKWGYKLGEDCSAADAAAE